jgi:uncharacterized repeat protein (TIGR04076 family)
MIVKVRAEDECRPIDLDGVTIRVVEASGCPYFAPGETTRLSDLLPARMCPDLFFTAYPYVLGLAGGAWYNWSREKDVVAAQCPAPRGKVAFAARRKTREHVRLEVLSSTPQACGYRHREGQTIDVELRTPTCRHAFGVLYPYVRHLAAGPDKGSCRVRCPDPTHACTFELTRTSEAEA